MNHSRDPGLQNERTALAWQRTALSVLTGAIILTRLTYDELGAAAVVCLAVAVPVSLWVFWESRGRYQHDARIRLRPRLRSGRAAAATATSVAALGIAELVAIVLT